MENEERRSKRKLVLENTTYMLLPSATEKTFDCVITDINKFGVGLLTTSNLQDGQRIIIENNKHFSETSAIVKWSQRFGDILYKIGLEYLENQGDSNSENQRKHQKLHTGREVSLKEKSPLAEKSTIPLSEELSKKNPPMQEEKHGDASSPNIPETAEVFPAEKDTDASEDFISQEIIESEEKKRESKTTPVLLVFLLIVAAVAGIVYYSGVLQREEPAATNALGTEQIPLEEHEKPLQPERIKRDASKAGNALFKPSRVPSSKLSKPTVQSRPSFIGSSATPLSSAKSPVPELADIMQCEKTYSVQVGVFRNNLYAVTYAKQFIGKRYDVFIDKTDLKDQAVIYRVLIGQFKNMQEASQLAMDVREKENIDAFIICK